MAELKLDEENVPKDLSRDATVSYIPSNLDQVQHIIDSGTDEHSHSIWKLTGFEDVYLQEPSHLADSQGASFKLQRIVGKGGMGEVWEALQLSLGRIIAIKKFARPPSDERERLARAHLFRHEAFISARLEHPNIVPVHDLGTDGEGNPVIAMKLVKGKRWSDLLQADFEHLSVNEYLTRHLPILIDVGQAVAFAHSKGIVHRDIKPGQVMVGEFGEVLLIDWGLAIFMEKEENAPGSIGLLTRKTASNPSGTPALMAPEQTETSAENIGPWTDVYLLGATLYYMLTGHYPHESSEAADAFRKARSGFVTPPSALVWDREIPGELEEICLKALSQRKEDRISPALKFVDLVSDYMSGAGKKRQSEAITSEIERDAENSERKYQEYAEWVNRIEQAHALWRENPKVNSLRDKILTRYAQTALSHQDLVLASLQIESIENEKLKQPVLEELKEAELHKESKDRIRKVALTATFVFAILLISGSLYFNTRTSRQLTESQQAEESAEKLRGDAEELLTSLLVQPSDTQNPNSRVLTQFEQGEKILAYFESLSTNESSRKSELRHAQVMDQLADLHASNGNWEKSLEYLDQSAKIAQRLLNEDDSNLIAENYLYETRIRIANSLIQSGNLNQALTHLNTNLKLLESRGKTGGQRNWESRQKPSLLLKIASLYHQQENSEQAQAMLSEAIELQSRFQFEEPHEAQHRGFLTEMHLLMAKLASEQNDTPAFERHVSAARILIQELGEIDPEFPNLNRLKENADSISDIRISEVEDDLL